MGDDVSYKYGFGSSFLRISVSIPDFYELGDWVAAPGAWFSSTWPWAFFCQNQVMMKDPPPLEARASMSGDVLFHISCTSSFGENQCRFGKISIILLL